MLAPPTRWIMRVGLDPTNGQVVIEGPVDRKDDCVTLLAQAIEFIIEWNLKQHASPILVASATPPTT